MKTNSIFSALFLGVSLAVLPPALFADESSSPNSSNTQGTSTQSSQQSSVSPNAFGLPDFTALVEKTNVVVVNISTNKKVGLPKNHPQFKGLPEDLLRYFFGIPQSQLDEFKGRFKDEPRQDEPTKKQPHALGSGFIISDDGYILTNHHVINGSDEIIVRMRDRKELKAQVIGSDERSDVALLKIEATGLPYAKIGSQKNLKVGQWVLAIGEPFGLDYTVTHGIISALGRALPKDTYVPFIQSDVAVNPGNSGGPLFNLAGEVVGVNSQIYSSNGGSMGLSFSIPIDIAMNIAEQLKSKGAVSRGYLGVSIQEVTSELSASFGLDQPKGALISEAFPDTPASKAGLKSGDIVLVFDGKNIHKSSDLPPLVGLAPIGKTVKLKVLRQGKTQWIDLTIAALEAEKVPKLVEQKTSTNNLLGAELQDLDKETLKQLNLPFGVGVREVTAPPAKNAGLKQGDVIVTIDFKPVKSIKGLNKLLDSLPKNRALALRVIRDGSSLFLALRLEK